jgi:glucosyl-dolichyl phosphate glucuronosyltransferase
MTVQISAIICTHNRAPYLRKAIQSLIEQTLPPDCYEIIVVDNHSSDETRDVVEAFGNIGHLRYVFEPVPGLSRARNTGWRQAQGQYVAFLDDDAVARPHWIEKYLEAFETTKPLPGSVGGKCEPIWEAPRPDWLDEKLLTSLSVYDWSDHPIILTKDQWVSGCNIAYPVDVLARIGGFREDLGRTGKNLLAGEETFVRRQLDSLGYNTLYHPEIAVGHHISPSRMNKTWFRKHAFGTGKSQAFMDYGGKPLSMPRRLQLAARRALWALPRLGLMLAARSADKRFYREYQAYEAAGFISGLWQLRHGAQGAT